MTVATKILIGKASRAEAESLRTRLSSHEINLALVYNPSTCSSGCSSQLEIWAHPDDVSSIEGILKADWHSAVTSNGYDPKLAEAVFDPSSSEVTCPACATVFVPTRGDCPDCGLQFSAPVEDSSGGCGPGKGCK